ncbi:MAG TPA: flagellar export chaperone FliS, partial [Candidatus Obscuribacterales bacterium]
MKEATAHPAPIRLSPATQAGDNVQRVDSYKAAHIETATPERLLVMLYDGALKYLGLAVQTIDGKDIEGTHRNLLKAEAIVLELMSVLDMEIGGELAANLFNLYDYMYRQLVKANIHRDPEPVKEVMGLLEPLRNAWNEASEMVAQMRAEGKFDLATP